VKDLLFEWNLFLDESKGSKLERVTTFISREIVRALKDEEVRAAFAKTESVSFLLVEDAPEVEWLRDIVVKLTSNEDYVYTHASYEYTLGATDEERKDSDMIINIVLPKNYDNSIFSELIPDLKDSIRHELEHSVQPTEMLSGNEEIKSSEAIWQSLDIARAYYTSESETNAHVAGLYKKAKVLKEPFEDVVNHAMYEIWQTGIYYGFADDDVDKLVMDIRDIWLRYGAERYPRAQFSGEA
jgi:hypothetical protein|tara:strand:+ start:8607 stop:9329 length:723 start_codon:yes stop_codon:yes gene_type:complete